MMKFHSNQGVQFSKIISCKTRNKLLNLPWIRIFMVSLLCIMVMSCERTNKFILHKMQSKPTPNCTLFLLFTSQINGHFDSWFQPSFDDVCYMDSVITRVTLSEVEPEKFAISKPHIKQTKKLLKEALVAERGEEDVLLDGGIEKLVGRDNNNNDYNNYCYWALRI